MKEFFKVMLLGWIFCSTSAQAQKVVNDTVPSSAITDSVSLGEVVVKARKILKKSGGWTDIKPVQVATVGGANGNIYQALQTLPGTQVQGESGRLLVRGGSSDETQTYIDGMHVMNPYTTTGENTPVRGRYSPFMFSGINLSTGGHSQEYGGAMSAVLPLETKDHSLINKIGVSPSTVGIGGGGTRVLDKGSLSVNLDYQNTGPYFDVFPGRVDFKRPYQQCSAASQYRYTPSDNVVFKAYGSYDRTDYTYYDEDDGHPFRLGENNVYLNSTLRVNTPSGWDWFAGVAYSYLERHVGGAKLEGDNAGEKETELHLKTKVFKRIRPYLQLDMGAEAFIRRYELQYDFGPVAINQQMTPTIEAAYVSTAFYPLDDLKAEVSARAEYTTMNRKLDLSPRLALTYLWNDVLFSANLGRYTQLPVNSYLIQQTSLLSEACWQYNAGALYEADKRFYKAEVYYKKYNRLALNTPLGLTSDGYGTSKGVDLYFEDRTLIRNLEYYVSYSFNVSKRKYHEYPELTTPQYATRHNASLVMKYMIPKLRTIAGVTERFASGRPFHNPALPGLMNDKVKPYNTVDLSLTILANKKVIVHASATNILCRKNVFGKVDGKDVLTLSDHFYYVGVFITLGKNAAYDVSNF